SHLPEREKTDTQFSASDRRSRARFTGRAFLPALLPKANPLFRRLRMSRSLRALTKKLRTYLGLERRERLADLRRRPSLEPLEARTLLSTATLLGVPDWVNQGPGPIANGQAAGLHAGGIDNPVAGAVSAIAPHPTNPKIVYVGTVNGGVWKTN